MIKRMKVLFCDFDNVITESIDGIVDISLEACKKIKEILDKTGSIFVATTKSKIWFSKENIEYRMNRVKSVGIEIFESFDYSFGDTKGSKIEEFLKKYDVEKFCIIDDKDDDFSSFSNHFILIDHPRGVLGRNYLKKIEERLK